MALSHDNNWKKGTNMTPSQRQNPMSCNGMVTSPHYLASQAGLDILRRGGTAVDAAVATAATLTVVYPHMSALGGDNFWLIYNARTGELKALNASGRAGEKASIDFYRKQGLTRVPARGPLAANTVPGAVSGWDAAWQYSRAALGSKQSFATLLETARDLAERGFPVSEALAFWSRVDTDPADQESRNLQQYPGFAATYLKPDGKPYGVGEIFRQPDLAVTLGVLADKGADEFYKGSLAAKIAKGCVLLTEQDFARHTADWVDPISVPYRDCQAFNVPPTTQGMASLEILNILNNFDLSAIAEGSADYCHLIIEATKAAFRDRNAYLSDPAFVDIPLDRLLSAEYGRQQAASIRMDSASPCLNPLDPKGDTIWLGVVDREGNAVSLIQSIYHDFGSGIVPGGTGVLLQNRGTAFSLDPAHVNCLMPGKRTSHTLNPAMLFKNGRPLLVYGTMGGEGQPQTQAAVVTRMIDYGMTPQQAIDAPRWAYGRNWGADRNTVRLENRIPQDVIDELARRGHDVRVEPTAYTDVMGHAGAILIDQMTGVLKGGTDPRSDGLACGY